MKCAFCGNSAVTNLFSTDLNLCRGCFQSVLFKRVKLHLRSFGVLRNFNSIVIVDDNSLPSLFLKRFFDSEFSMVKRLKIVFRSSLRSVRNSLIILPNTLTFECNYFFYCMFNNVKHDFFVKAGKGSNVIIKPLISVLDSDLVKWSSLFNVKGTVNTSFILENTFLNGIESRRKAVRFSILNFLEQF